MFCLPQERSPFPLAGIRSTAGLEPAGRRGEAQGHFSQEEVNPTPGKVGKRPAGIMPACRQAGRLCAYAVRYTRSFAGLATSVALAMALRRAKSRVLAGGYFN